MADKVYIPNLVVNEISEDLIDHVADEVGAKLTIDTTNLAKLNEGNIFKKGCTFEQDCLFGGQVVIGKLKSVSNPNVMTPKEWTTLTDNEIPTKKQIVDITDNKVSKTGPETIEGVKTFASIPLCQQRPTNGHQLANKDYVDSVAGGGGSVDTSNFAQLTNNNTFTGVQTFNNNVSINGTLDVGDTNLRGNTTFYSNSIFKGPLVVANNTTNQELAITPILNGVSINLGDDCTLTMNPKMISELKRLLGIQ